MLGKLVLVSVRGEWRPSRSSLTTVTFNLFKYAKQFKLPLYTRSYWVGAPILNLELCDRTLKVVNRLFPKRIFILAERAGRVVSDLDLLRLYKALRQGFNVVMLEGNLGGVDARLRRLWPLVELSAGNFPLSNGRVLWSMMRDYLDRSVYATESGFFWDRIPRKMWGRPRVYRGLRVPEVMRSGDHARVIRFLEEDEAVGGGIPF